MGIYFHHIHSPLFKVSSASFAAINLHYSAINYIKTTCDAPGARYQMSLEKHIRVCALAYATSVIARACACAF